MQKVTLTAVYHNDKDRDGKPYTTKDGKPYTRCNIKATEYGDKYISGFGGKTTRTWNVGDTVEIEIEQKGEYLNFTVPKVEQGGFTENDRKMLQAIYAHINRGKQPEGQTEELTPEDIPF